MVSPDKAERQKSAARLGNVIRRMRLSHKLTQMELAAKIGVSYQQLQKYEYGVSEITVPRLMQIADALQVPLRVFLNENGETYEGLPQDPGEVKVLRLYRGLGDRRLRRMAEQVLDIISEYCRGGR